MATLKADYSIPSSSKKAKQHIANATFESAKREFWKWLLYETMSWLHSKVEKMTEHCACKLFCMIYQKYDDKIYVKWSTFYVLGSPDLLTKRLATYVVDHAKSDQHKA